MTTAMSSSCGDSITGLATGGSRKTDCACCCSARGRTSGSCNRGGYVELTRLARRYPRLITGEQLISQDALQDGSLAAAGKDMIRAVYEMNTTAFPKPLY